jgi:hypothetical protein
MQRLLRTRFVTRLDKRVHADHLAALLETFLVSAIMILTREGSKSPHAYAGLRVPEPPFGGIDTSIIRSHLGSTFVAAPSSARATPVAPSSNPVSATNSRLPLDPKETDHDRDPEQLQRLATLRRASAFS